MIDQIRSLFVGNETLPFDVEKLSDQDNLYDAGMTSFASVQIMLAIEEQFDIEFPEEMLTRRTFASLANIADAVSKLTKEAA
ncbi:acyl carrier protein [Mesorhizobium soli]|jgi:acyl carrier protein|uniref:acyl carrier protein n=1 Tax=Pseudaminobacter soli (ex Li et al. 2025) TaxID=1295366 RepID=UPI002475C343|nr:acyl carrier protein [Mesorhizobium soli]MDH6230497.1 acyl carrier protein [Mesorhizobium soli]